MDEKFKWIEICPQDQLVVIRRLFRVAMDDEPLDSTEKQIYEAIISKFKRKKDGS